MKKLFLILLILLMCSCSSKYISLETIVENNPNMFIAINYPTTNIKELDNKIIEYIKTTQEAFKNEYENYYVIDESAELNIDYKYFETDNYINIILYTFVDSSKLAHPINEIKTFVYDTKLNKIISLKDFINEEQLKQVVPIIKQKVISKYKECVIMESLTSEIIPNYKKYPNFTISETLNIYFQPYEITSGFCNVIDISINLEELNIYLNKKEDNTTFNYIPVIKTIDPYQKSIAITFDDGPSKYTEDILEILNKNDAYATFFVLGNKVEIYNETINKALKYGNEIGNHSYNHKWLTRLSTEEFKEQIDKTQNIIYQYTNYYPKLLRPTYGSINNKIKNNTNLDIVLWNVDSLDWKLRNCDKVVNRVINDVEDMDIILFHDTYKSTKDAIEKIVPLLKEQGYQLVTVSELYEIKKIRNQN